MEKRDGSITFSCPGWGETFQFDDAGKDQFVPCQICGIEFITVRKGETLPLELFEFNQKNPDMQNETTRPVESELR